MPDDFHRTAGVAAAAADRSATCPPGRQRPLHPDTGEVLAEAQEVIPASPPQLPGTGLKIEIAALGDKLGLSRAEVAELWHAERGTSIRDTQDITALTAFRAELQTRLGEVQR
jgi:hypothetical protein